MKLIAFALFLIFITWNVFSLGNKEMDNTHNSSVEENAGSIVHDNRPDAEAGSTTMILGKIQIYGNDPHTFVGIIDGNGIEYALYPQSQEEELRKLQGRLIEFTVVLLDKPQGYGGLFLNGGTVMPVTWKIIQ